MFQCGLIDFTNYAQLFEPVGIVPLPWINGSTSSFSIRSFLLRGSGAVFFIRMAILSLDFETMRGLLERGEGGEFTSFVLLHVKPPQ